MKATLIISFLLLCLLPDSRAQKLQFTFDTAGNQAVRTWQPSMLAMSHRDTVRRAMGYGARVSGYEVRGVGFAVRGMRFEFFGKGDLVTEGVEEWEKRRFGEAVWDMVSGRWGDLGSERVTGCESRGTGCEVWGSGCCGMGQRKIGLIF